MRDTKSISFLPVRSHDATARDDGRLKVEAVQLPFPFVSPIEHRLAILRAAPLLKELEPFIYDDGALFCMLDGTPAATFRQGAFLLRCHRTKYGKNLEIEIVPLLMHDRAVLCAHPDAGPTVLHLVRYLKYPASAISAHRLWNVDFLLCERTAPDCCASQAP